MSAARAAFAMTFQLSPIIFTGGIAQFIGGALPIILITETLNFVGGILSGGQDIDLDNFFANFWPVAGSELVSNTYPTYPLASQQVAANARLKNPTNLSMRMVCPARGEAGYAAKLAIMTALISAVELHAALGGTYTVATPAQFFPNCLLNRIVDTSAGNSAQAQNTFQWDFYRPLVTLANAVQAQSSLMGQITSGIPIAGNPPSWSGLPSTTGNPASLASIGLLPAAGLSAGPQVAQPTVGIDQ